MAGDIYRKPVSFAILAAVTVLIGSVVTMAYPMLRPEMHAKLDDLRAFSPLELAGRDIYQREGCVGCHTQTVRPLRSEVQRYGDYSKAGEFYFDRPFLWGSKRTGPDLAREGGKRPDGWHQKHYADPQAVTPRSNMPRYAFLNDARLDPAEAKAHYQVLASLSPKGEWKATDADFAALAQKTEMEALIAYTQWLGHAVQKKAGGGAIDLAAVNPLAGNPQAVTRGAKVYEENCAVCHGAEGRGETQIAPDLMDATFLGEQPDMPDGAYFGLIAGGSDAKPALGRKGLADGGMTAFGGQIANDDIWAVISWIRSRQAQAKQAAPAQPARP